MAAKGKVDWFGDEVLLKLAEASQVMIDAAALEIDGQTKLNIQANGQIDTGFMVNTVYVVTPLSNTYGNTRNSSQEHSSKQDRSVARRIAPQADAPVDGAIVAVGAEYAIYQEMRNSFLYLALEQVAATRQGAIVAKGKAVVES